MNQILDNAKNNNYNKKSIKNINNKIKDNNINTNNKSFDNTKIKVMNKTETTNINRNVTKASKPKYIISINKYKLQFFASIVVLILAISLLVSNIYSYTQKENISKNLLNSISITRLYSNEQNYTTMTENTVQNGNESQQEEPFVIGIIQIEKINVNYPILSKTSRELLKVSLCRCAGPMPNEVGNLCIAGHNLVDYKLFSRLNELNLKDKIKLYDLKGNVCEYEVFKKYEVSPTDLSCLSQNTENSKIVTLLTCNNVNGKRLIVVGKEV